MDLDTVVLVVIDPHLQRDDTLSHHVQHLVTLNNKKYHLRAEWNTPYK